MCLAATQIATNYVRNVPLATLRPTDIRFSKNTIKDIFTKSLEDGDTRSCRKIHDVIDDIRSGIINPHKLPPLKTFVQRNQWRTTNNRRLYMLRVLEVEGYIDYVQVQVVRRYKRLDLRDDGRTIRFEGGKHRPLRHRHKFWCFPRPEHLGYVMLIVLISALMCVSMV